jgi:hypothetical protein
MKKNLWVNLSTSLLLTLVSTGLVWLAVWSFQQTFELCIVAINLETALPLAFAIQFGQNAALYAKNTMTNPNHKVIAMLTWAALAFLDALTNLGQWFAEHPMGQFRAGNLVSVIGVIVGLSVCIGAIFVEEAFTYVFALCLNSWNDTLKAMGASGFKLLEIAAEQVRNAGFGGDDKKPQPMMETVTLPNGKQLELERPRNMPQPQNGKPQGMPGSHK